MPVVDPGKGVIDLVRSSSNRIVIAAPYIKSHTLRSLIAHIPDSITEFICITRWLPEDIASGVCDIEIFEDVTNIRGGELRVHPHLHAKFYSNTNQCLVGSANLTGRGLGWHTPANVELLVALSGDFPGLSDWEAALLESSVTATKELRDQILAEAERMPMPSYHSPEVEISEESDAIWVPTCTVPDRLWEIYQGSGADSIVTSAYDAAQSDLAALSPPHGLDQALFEAYVSGILRQMPFISEIDNLASTGVTDVQAHQFLTERLDIDVTSAQHKWRVLKLWLIHFFGNSYRLETGQEVLVKGKELPSR